jgi:hypothetical protein
MHPPFVDNGRGFLVRINGSRATGTGDPWGYLDGYAVWAGCHSEPEDPSIKGPDEKRSRAIFLPPWRARYQVG